ncbi:MAG TPA: serine/threonine-protein kinase [Allocoleopsis sp.]
MLDSKPTVISKSNQHPPHRLKEMLVGKTLRNRYKIIKQLGSGGCSETYIAEDWDLPNHPQCVVKRWKIKADSEALQLARRRFDTTAQVLHQLGNDYDQIPRILAYFEQDRDFYLVEEFIDGHDLSKELTSGKRLGEKEVIQLLQEILDVLVYLHQQHVIHRNLKPENLIRRRKDKKIVPIAIGTVKTIANSNNNGHRQSSEIVSLDTPDYMPLEQRLGHPQLCSDVYAVGTIGIQALTGLQPHEFPQDPKTCEIAWRERVRVSNQLADILTTMMRYDSNQRYQSAVTALQALQRLQTQSPPWKIIVGLGVVAVAAIAFVKLLPSHTSTETKPAQRASLVKRTSRIALVKKIPAHAQGISSMAIASDGQTLATGSFDKTIKLWNLQTGQELQTFRGHSGRILSVAIAPKQPILATGSDDKTIKLWNLKTGKEIRSFSGNLGWVYALAFSPDGKTLVSGSDNKTIKLWNLGTKEPPRNLLGHSGLIRSFAFSADGQLLVSSSADKTVKIWNLKTGKLLHNLAQHSNWVNSTAISPDGQSIASGSSDKTIKLWNLQTGKLLRNLQGHTSGVSSVAFSPNGQFLVSGSSDNTIKLWNWQTGEAIDTLNACTKGVSSVAFSRDGKTLVSSCWDNAIATWRVSP